MPLIPPKIDSHHDSVVPSTSSSPLLECPSCAQPVASTNDQFCRHCGLRILMRCSKCSAPVRPSDKFCPACGAKRWQFFELWRYGILHRSPVFVIGVTAAAAIGYLVLSVWDLGGQTSIRPYWRCYYSNTDAIIYVVDSADKDRIGISKQELISMLEEEELKNAVLMVLANKQDIPGCLTVTDVYRSLGLDALRSREFQIFKTSALKGEGLDEAMEWLANKLKEAK
ncbi:hypothetical protein FO519_002787 [Halicephalobus sp. NKZ332]|nr:hypothetical protein FO519_002787 [Halicephalobus sp. NKZ332]